MNADPEAAPLAARIQALLGERLALRNRSRDLDVELAQALAQREGVAIGDRVRVVRNTHSDPETIWVT